MLNQNIPLPAKAFFVAQNFQANKQNILLVCTNEEEAIKTYNQKVFFLGSGSAGYDILYLPSWDTIPYDRVSPNQNIMAERAATLSKLALNLSSSSPKQLLLITNAVNLLAKLPPPQNFIDQTLIIEAGMQYSAKELGYFLVENGFNRSGTAIDSGEFAIRGEIVDIILPNLTAYRINFAFDRIESIRIFDVESQISGESKRQLTINSANEAILSPDTINNFRNNYLRQFGVNQAKIPLYQALTEGKKFIGYEHLMPLLYNQHSFLLDYLDSPLVIYDRLSIQVISEHETNYRDLYQARLQSNKINPTSFYPALPPEDICFNSTEIEHKLDSLKPAAGYFSSVTLNLFQHDFWLQKPVFDKLFELFRNNPEKISVIFCSSASALERVKNICSNFESLLLNKVETLAEAKKGLVNLAKIPLQISFLTKDYIFIADSDLLGKKLPHSSKTDSKRRFKNILAELDNLQENELVVHKEYGIGRFLTLENLKVADHSHDFLKVLYANNDKLYIPVENIDTIKKYGNSEAELDRLGSAAWQKRKARLKNRISEMAQKLLQVTAQRKLATVLPVDYDNNLYDKFCGGFNYSETEDQARAIEEVKNDLISGVLMDRLICGDVGFGKTEVALRAAFMIAANKSETAPQVALVAPTTILCRQHYLRFLERFNSFGFNVVQLSGLIQAKEARLVKEQIKSGRANIVIGTHALLSKDIEFANLRLLVIDEEHHFGVAQKERLKELKSGVHVLSLSATPIPRTLQMSMVGLKDLSLIATPPIDRLAVRTTIMPFDAVIIKDALLREHFRGGRSFYVCPRIKDITVIEKLLTEMVPELKYKVAHGQMPATKLDEIMQEFYDGKLDILLSTTIIESGIDIAAANTLIIHNSDQLGLSQLYQLRGRVGRSKARGYAYLTIGQSKSFTKQALRRLEIIQSIDTLGGGFTIASHDMDLRGFGNLVGEEQSGHIKEVGVELYQDMLDQAISACANKDRTESNDFVPNINLGLSVFIPDTYIEDLNLRLGLYRRVGELVDEEDADNFRGEMIDRFGPIPPEFDNLLKIVTVKQTCIKFYIESIDSGNQGFVLKFRKNAAVSEMVMAFLAKHPKSAKIRPDNRLVFMKSLHNANVIKELKVLLNELGSGYVIDTTIRN